MVHNVRVRWLLCGAVAVAVYGSSVGRSSPALVINAQSARGPFVRTLRAPDAKGSPPAAPHRWPGPGWLSKEAVSGKHVIYVANDDQITIFPNHGRNPGPIGAITDGISYAYGLFVDQALNLYVCNAGKNTVTVYSPGQTAPSFTYSDGLHTPLYAAADSQRLFVSNWGGGSVTEYALGNGTPQYTLQTPGVEADGINLDAGGNLYVAYRKGDGRRAGGIEYFAQGVGPGKDLGMRLTAPQGLIVDPSGNILVAETESASRIEAFAPGQTKRYAHSGHLRSIPTQIQLDAQGKNLYVSVLSYEIRRIPYPRFKPALRYLHNSVLDGIQGMAVSPPAPL
jgi:DNA-binding beta-propeller fold protein YncE